MTGLQERIVVVVVNVRYLDSAEVVTHVCVRHPEQTFRVIVPALLLDVVGPEV